MYFGYEGIDYLCSRMGRSREGHGGPRATSLSSTTSNRLRWGSKSEATNLILKERPNVKGNNGSGGVTGLKTF
jgi:hypothetical protein